jgi:pyruvate/2-oxoglutarate dehydrogenase complex dihydrolipoamide acyltransferase (E2) component
MTNIRIPKFGMSTVEVDIMELHIAVGQTLAVGDPVAEIETDKVTTTLAADAGGVVAQVLAEAGQTMQVGDVICVLAD